MEDNCYRKIYYFEKAVFVEKFIARTIPFDERQSRSMSLGRKLDGRVFVGEICGDNFKVVTIPDIWDAVRHPWPGIRKTPVWRTLSCIHGSIQESEGYTIVECTIDIMKMSKLVSGQGIVIGCLGILVCIMSVSAEVFQPGTLIAIVLFGICIISSNSVRHYHQSEHDALVKFMEDLED